VSRILVTGGAGYVGSALVPKLLARGHDVRVLDLYLYGEDALSQVASNPLLEELRGDIRDASIVARAVDDRDTIVHLACISNDPSFELDPQLGKSINYDAFRPLVRAAKRAGVTRFVYASSSSVYGVKNHPDVTEDDTLEPLTDYSRYKALCEGVLDEEREPGFTTLTLRPATVCGYAPRLRLDLTVNILTSAAYHDRRIVVHGGAQLRPNIHVDDMADLYVQVCEATADSIDGRVWNAGYDNLSVSAIADLVRAVVGDDVEVEHTPTVDLRSYHISSERIRREFGFVPRRSVERAIGDLVEAFDAGRVRDALTSSSYYNVRRMQEVTLR
jgi:nucleoside-diphosphate-sugar epimerase